MAPPPEPPTRETRGKAKGKAKAKSKQPANLEPLFITLPRRDPSGDQTLTPFAVPVASASSSKPDNARPVRSTKKDEK